MQHKNDGVNKYFYVPFRACSDSDFINKGIDKEQVSKFDAKKYLCPDLKKEHSELFVVMNEFGNKKDRKSF